MKTWQWLFHSTSQKDEKNIGTVYLAPNSSSAQLNWVVPKPWAVFPRDPGWSVRPRSSHDLQQNTNGSDYQIITRILHLSLRNTTCWRLMLLETAHGHSGVFVFTPVSVYKISFKNTRMDLHQTLRGYYWGRYLHMITFLSWLVERGEQCFLWER